jgi:hypothetical protein
MCMALFSVPFPALTVPQVSLQYRGWPPRRKSSDLEFLAESCRAPAPAVGGGCALDQGVVSDGPNERSWVVRRHGRASDLRAERNRVSIKAWSRGLGELNQVWQMVTLFARPAPCLTNSLAFVRGRHTAGQIRLQKSKVTINVGDSTRRKAVYFVFTCNSFD